MFEKFNCLKWTNCILKVKACLIENVIYHLPKAANSSTTHAVIMIAINM